MEFFWAFLRSRGTSMSAAAASIGYTQPATARWMASDDIRTDVMHRLAAACGCVMDVSLARPADGEEEDAGMQAPQPVYVTDIVKGTGDGHLVRRSLDFVHVAMRAHGIRTKDWSARGGISVSNIYHWLNEDAMMWSRVCQFAHLFGFEVRVRFSLAEPAPRPEGEAVVIRVDHACSGTYAVPADLPDKSR